MKYKGKVVLMTGAGKPAPLSDGSAGNIQAQNQHTFFTGKTHIQNLLS